MGRSGKRRVNQLALLYEDVRDVHSSMICILRDRMQVSASSPKSGVKKERETREYIQRPLRHLAPAPISRHDLQRQDTGTQTITKKDSHPPPLLPPQPSHSPPNSPLIKLLHSIYQIATLCGLILLHIPPTNTVPIPPLPPTTNTILTPLQLQGSLRLSLRLRTQFCKLSLKMINLRCTTCVRAFEEALVGKEFGGVEGANLDEGLVEL